MTSRLFYLWIHNLTKRFPHIVHSLPFPPRFTTCHILINLFHTHNNKNKHLKLQVFIGWDSILTADNVANDVQNDPNDWTRKTSDEKHNNNKHTGIRVGEVVDAHG